MCVVQQNSRWCQNTAGAATTQQVMQLKKHNKWDKHTAGRATTQQVMQHNRWCKKHNKWNKHTASDATTQQVMQQHSRREIVCACSSCSSLRTFTFKNSRGWLLNRTLTSFNVLTFFLEISSTFDTRQITSPMRRKEITSPCHFKLLR